MVPIRPSCQRSAQIKLTFWAIGARLQSSCLRLWIPCTKWRSERRRGILSLFWKRLKWTLYVSHESFQCLSRNKLLYKLYTWLTIYSISASRLKSASLLKAFIPVFLLRVLLLLDSLTSRMYDNMNWPCHSRNASTQTNPIGKQNETRTKRSQIKNQTCPTT